MFTLEITADSAVELRTKVLSLANQFGPMALMVPGTVESGPEGSVQLSFPTDEPTQTEATQKTRKPRASKKAQEEAATEASNVGVQTPPTEAPTQAPAETSAPATTGPVSKEAAFEALTEVNKQRGMEVAREVLKKFNCMRISELKEADFGGFVAECKAVLSKPKAG